jgi:hypothetical protein
LSLFSDLLAKGMLPQELPPCFNSTSLAALALLPQNSLPSEFSNPPSSKPVPYSYARGGTGAIRRNLSIVNPISFYALANSVASNWPTINQHLQLTPLSQSRPMHWPAATRAFKTISYSNRFLVEPKAKNRASARAFLITDISQFYHSIYTHSIPWAFHTKTVAKANFGHNLFGNKLDSLVQRGQDRQTRGIPIGPDTSLVLAESILARVESEVFLRLPKLRGLRFIDDYELCFPDVGSAEKALSIIQEEMQKFELQLNPKKTRIVAPPIRFEHEWIGEFRTFVIRSNSGQHGDLVRYFDTITNYIQIDPEAHVAKYAMAKLVLNNFVPTSHNESLYQALLCQLLIAQPSAAREIASCLILLFQSGAQIDTELLQECFSELIQRAAPLGHHFEISWVLYVAMKLGLVLDKVTVESLSQSDNAVIALMTLDAWYKNLVPNLAAPLWWPRMTTADLTDEFWILSYEAKRLNWLPTSHDHIRGDAAFDFLRSKAVGFYTPV